jgi:hypothetical protein
MAAVLLAVIASNSGRGQHRLFADPQATRTEDVAKVKAAAVQAAQLKRLAAAEDETRRLVEMVRALNADRERVLTRVSALERRLEDVTGSIERQAKAAPVGAPAAPPSESLPKIAAVPPPAAPAEPNATTPPDPPKRTASNPSPVANNESNAQQSRPAAGVDIGGAANFDGLRALWNSMKSAHSDLFDGLHPIVTVRENSKSRAADLRLVAGPLTDLESATRICTTLAAAKHYCRLVTFEGAPLALVAPDPPARPTAAAKRPAPRPAAPRPAAPRPAP